ncbi:hypothetical protein MIR68_001161 [Amoeboaphelidium protococcarum]|nr:hypothetical protein MIR68_001161 [Amoeboaphelidium protococcarum]
MIINSSIKFQKEALQSGIRLDGRQLLQHRGINLIFNALGNVIVEFQGEVDRECTRVLATINCKPIEPAKERPNEGSLYMTIESNNLLHGGRDEEVHLSRLLEKVIKSSRCLDTESLCILAGTLVWDIQLVITVIENCGNLESAVCLAATAALLHFRRPDVRVKGEQISIGDSQSVPLSLHHIPVCSKLCFYQQATDSAVQSKGDLNVFIGDPTCEEESLSESQIVVAMNAQQEICFLQKIGGVVFGVDELFSMMDPQNAGIVWTHTQRTVAMLKEAVTTDLKQRDIRLSSLKHH